MPTPSYRAPSQWSPFGSEEEHLQAHRALDAALIGTDTSINSTGTISTPVAIVTQIGLGGLTPGTSSTAAPVKGLYRTAAAVNVGIPSMSTSSITATIVSVESQMGNPIQPGVPIIVSPQPSVALPAGVYLGQAYCVDTNSITFSFFSRSGINATTTVAFHVFAIDTIP